jgi:hypothetical protein
MSSRPVWAPECNPVSKTEKKKKKKERFMFPFFEGKVSA